MAVAAVGLACAGRAQAQGQPPPSAPAPAVVNPDPYEKINRKSYALFRYLDRRFIRPAAVFYAHATPKVVRTGLHNTIQNVGEPVIFFNDVLQLHPKAAAQTLGRFVVNSTLGVAGLGDPATRAGIAYHKNGFGTTLGRYGAPPGPYIFIPVLGPSDVRDAIGDGVDTLSDPLTWINYTGRWAVGVAHTVVGGLDTRANSDAQLKQLDAMATDSYASVRSLYLQNRQAQISGGQVSVTDLPDFGPPDASSNAAGAPASPPASVGPPGLSSALPRESAPPSAPPADAAPPRP